MIKTNSDNLIDLERLEIGDIVNLDKLAKFQSGLAEKTGCALTVVDRDGKNITPYSHICKYCEYYVRSNKSGTDKCMDSHDFFGREAFRFGRIYINKCHAGIMEFAVPVAVDGEYLGAVIGGQYVTESPREKDAKEYASKLGADAGVIFNAMSELQRVEKKYMDELAEIFSVPVNSMVKEGYILAQLDIMSGRLAENTKEVSDTLGDVLEASENITSHQKELNQSVANVDEASVKIEEVLQSISKLADETKILSFNAQIEAVRAGEVGKSFTVVAGEIKELADTSKNTAENIADLTATIKTNVQKTVNFSDETLEAARTQTYAMESAKDSAEALTEISNQLESFLLKNKSKKSLDK